MAEQSHIHCLGSEGRVFDVAMAELEVLEAVFLCFALAVIHDVFGVIHADDLAGIVGEQFADQTLTGTKIRDIKRRYKLQE